MNEMWYADYSIVEMANLIFWTPKPVWSMLKADLRRTLKPLKSNQNSPRSGLNKAKLEWKPSYNGS